MGMVQLFHNLYMPSSMHVTSLTSLLLPFMALPTHLPLQHKLHPLLIHSTISCSLWSLMLVLGDFNAHVGSDFQS